MSGTSITRFGNMVLDSSSPQSDSYVTYYMAYLKGTILFNRHLTKEEVRDLALVLLTQSDPDYVKSLVILV